MEMKAWRAAAAAVVIVCFRSVFAEVAPRYKISSQVHYRIILISWVENAPSQAAFERLSQRVCVCESAASSDSAPPS